MFLSFLFTRIVTEIEYINCRKLNMCNKHLTLKNSNSCKTNIFSIFEASRIHMVDAFNKKFAINEG